MPPIEQNNAALTSDFEQKFSFARAEIQNKYGKASLAAKSDELRGTVGRTIIYRLFSDKYADNDFTIKIKHAIISFFNESSIHDAFKYISNVVTNTDKIQYDKLLGNYHYWRWFPKEHNQTLFEIRRGLISISRDGPTIVYRHRSANAANDVEWEDTGVVLATSQRVYMVGLRKRNIRLSISHIPDAIFEELFHGIVLSTQEKSGKIFSSSFIMAHESNLDYFNRQTFSLDEFKRLRCCEPMVNEAIMID